MFLATKTSNFSALMGYKYLVDTSTGVVTATLPASPAEGDCIEFYDSKANWNVHHFTIARNGNPIAGDASDLICDVSNIGLKLTYTNPTVGWHLATDLGSLQPLLTEAYFSPFLLMGT